MCGVAGIALAGSNTSIAPELHEACFHLQHRGQDSWGFAAQDANANISLQKRMGLVSASDHEVLDWCETVKGPLGISHVRYRTSGRMTMEEVQPLVVDTHGHKIAFCHNGHLPGNDTTLTDSSVLLQTFSRNLTSAEITTSGLVKALGAVYASYRGAFACLAMIDGSHLVGFRDPWALKPLVYGYRKDADTGNTDYLIASENIALQKLGFHMIADVRPGEAIIISTSQTSQPTIQNQQVAQLRSWTPDALEYIYFARADSRIDGISVQKARIQLGKALAQTIRTSKTSSRHIDVVIPVPETSYVCALACAQALGVPFAFGLSKSRYVGRTFIMPHQSVRRSNVHRKLSALREEFEGRHVLIIDDSIVRGTTSTDVVSMAYAAGAAEVSFASCSPVIRFEHRHGIDLSRQTDLIGHDRSLEGIKTALGCNHLFYLPVDQMEDAILASRDDLLVEGLEIGVFTGTYATDDWLDNASPEKPSDPLTRADSFMMI